MKATLIKLNQVNRNGRIYTDNENLRSCIEEYNNNINKLPNNLPNYGEFGYPSNFEISFKNVSHVINDVRIEGDEVVADIKILNTPNGKILNEDINNIVFRPRCIGKVDDNGYVHVQKLISFDAIFSDDDAFSTMKPKNEIKRIINDNDPYGEENWEN
jgi:hypothetical protein